MSVNDEMTGGPNELNGRERDMLRRYEEEIERREAQSFRRAWPLREIRDNRLYRSTGER